MSQIVHIPDKVLYTPAANVTKFDKKLSIVISDMKKTLIKTSNPKGVGLAAPQVGISLRIFIMRPHEKDKISVFINPEITNLNNLETNSKTKLEGCLSIPNIWGHVKRSTELTLKYQDEQGISKSAEFKGFSAIIIQHETDHLNGILFSQRVLEQKGKFYQNVTTDDGKEQLEEINLK